MDPRPGSGRPVASILIIEDMPEIRRMLKRRLKSTHEVVGELSDGHGAVAEVERSEPDVVVIDWQLPRVSGIDATRNIKAAFPDVVVVSYTSAGSGVRERMLEAGATAVFAKEDLAGLVEFLSLLP